MKDFQIAGQYRQKVKAKEKSVNVSVLLCTASYGCKLQIQNSYFSPADYRCLITCQSYPLKKIKD